MDQVRVQVETVASVLEPVGRVEEHLAEALVGLEVLVDQMVALARLALSALAAAAAASASALAALVALEALEAQAALAVADLAGDQVALVLVVHEWDHVAAGHGWGTVMKI